MKSFVTLLRVLQLYQYIFLYTIFSVKDGNYFSLSSLKGK